MVDYVFATGGSKLLVADAIPATNTKAAMETLNWDELGYVQNLGEIGNTWNIQNFFPVSSQRGIKIATTNINSDTSIVTSYSGANESGEEIVRTAAATAAKKVFAIEHSSGKNFYFHAKVTGDMIQLGSADDITTSSFPLALTEEDILIEDAPASL